MYFSDTTFQHVSPPKRAPSAAMRMFSPVDYDDLEVETVLGDGNLIYGFFVFNVWGRGGINFFIFILKFWWC